MSCPGRLLVFSTKNKIQPRIETNKPGGGTAGPTTSIDAAAGIIVVHPNLKQCNGRLVHCASAAHLSVMQTYQLGGHCPFDDSVCESCTSTTVPRVLSRPGAGHVRVLVSPPPYGGLRLSRTCREDLEIASEEIMYSGPFYEVFCSPLLTECTRPDPTLSPRLGMYSPPPGLPIPVQIYPLGYDLIIGEGIRKGRTGHFGARRKVRRTVKVW